ncbi:tRNA lysidine(34) synthetase TilS [Xylophilus sp. GOD-11R]|uniref:tRNA lysidine(34) synthetase TilS n=1 Tax=Xylophilus sp. GOD-11R TaxID=3089814 RepID=UPI00298C3F95|nr:tRNA lysidine(34) synthetase TilS [Xylophilus sp. GOD-11R]WPB58897.1 tRNA lysidine(34) synthetase TilS [Xylophilus sp. GOD-11R]
MTTVTPDPVSAAIAAFEPTFPLAVACSGGADSTALLAACSSRWPGQVRAVHVHHGLQEAADDFVARCEQTCRNLQVPLTVLKVDARHAPGESPENAARTARYRALDAYAQGTGAAAGTDEGAAPVRSIALAHHADDQVETMLLALSRGAGLAGLACMPARWERDGVEFHRPLLEVSGAAVRGFALAFGLGWAEDPSNDDERYTRNRIRARLMPALETTFPHFRETFVRSALHAAQAQSVLDEVAAADLEAVGAPPRLKDLQALSVGRQAQVLRRWLRTIHDTTPDTAQLAELQRQLAACRTRGHQLRLKVGRGFVVREGDALGWYNPAVLPPAT